MGMRSLLRKQSHLSAAQRSSLSSIVTGTIPSITEAYYLDHLRASADDQVRGNEVAGDPERTLTRPNCPKRSATARSVGGANPEGTLTRPICPACGASKTDYAHMWWECDFTRNAKNQYFSGQPRLAQADQPLQRLSWAGA